MRSHEEKSGSTGKVTPTPWYREPWPWILMAAPAAAIVAGVATYWLAVSSADGLVADDYYRRGLAINQELEREQRAAERGIQAHVTREGALVRVTLRGAAPEALHAHLVHGTRAGFDQRLRLAPVAPGVYESELPPLPPGPWRVILQDPRGEWRLTRTLTPPRERETAGGGKEGS